MRRTYQPSPREIMIDTLTVIFDAHLQKIFDNDYIREGLNEALHELLIDIDFDELEQEYLDHSLENYL